MLKQWTVMVYLAGDNNLSEEMIYSIKEMYRVGASQDFAVTIQFDPSAISPKVRRYEITRENIEDSKKRYPEIGLCCVRGHRCSSRGCRCSSTRKLPTP